MLDKQNLAKKILSEFLGFLKYKVDNDKLTLDEEQALVNLIEGNLPLSGTSDDFADYYGQSPVNVRCVIHRKMLAKPVRKVLYPFLSFARVIPSKWKSRCK